MKKLIESSTIFWYRRSNLTEFVCGPGVWSLIRQQKVSLGQESKRNKWREARREAPFMPDCDLDPSSPSASQRSLLEGYQGQSPGLKLGLE
jgi:hypothetical protein